MTSFQLQSSGGYVQGKYILCVCPLYNVNGKLIIQQFLQQGIKNWSLLLINDGSNDVITREYNLLKEQYNKEGRIVFLENKTHLGRAHCMNMGLELFHENTLFSHFTWLSCCDQYFPDYLVTIFSSFSANIQFVYTNFYEKLDGIKHAVANDCSYESKEDFLKNYTNIACPIWTRKAVDHIGKFNGSIQGYEGYDYLKRTFTLLQSNEIYYNNTVTMGCFCRQRLQYFKEGDAIEKLAKEKLAKEKLATNVLMCSHSNLAHTAGDTIMWSNWANYFMKNGKHVTLISKYPIPEHFLKNLQSKKYDIIVKRNDNEIVAEMDKLESKHGSIFIRNHEILDMLKNKPYLPKITFYGLDVHINGLSKMDNKFQKIITQSEQLKEKFIHTGIIESKIEIKEPLVFKYDFKLPERKDDEIRLIYCGTLRDEENILEIIEEFQKIHKERPEVVLKIVYGKINGNAEFTQKVNHYIKQGVKGITFKHNLSHKDSCYEIATSDIGICWRKNGWGDNGEVSTKVREYELYNLPVIKNNLMPLFNENKILLMIPYCKIYKPFIDECVESAVTQYYTNFEIIIINDGVKGFDKKYHKTKILYYKHKYGNGPGASKYHFIKYLQDNYNDFDNETIVAIEDGDDFLLTKSTFTLINLHYNINNSLLSCGSHKGKWDDIVYHSKSYLSEPNIRKNPNFYFPAVRTFKMKLVNYINLQDFIYPEKTFIQKATDKVLFLRLIEMCGKDRISVIFRKLSYYREHSNCSYKTLDADYKKRCIEYIENLPSTSKIINFDDIKSENQKIFINFLKQNNITHCRISNSLSHFSRCLYIYGLYNYDGEDKEHKKSNTLFFGLYTGWDIDALCKHQGHKYILYGGTDCNEDLKKKYDNVINIKNKHPDAFYISISDCIHNRLTQTYNIPTNNITRLVFDMVDYNIFYKKQINNDNSNIFIYDGNSTTNEQTYNKDMCDEIEQKLKHKYTFVRTSNYDFNKRNTYDSMYNFYKQFFIILRLTPRDGNSNTPTECQVLGKPIVHNQSDYGLKWKNTNDVINHIEKISREIEDHNNNSFNIVVNSYISDEAYDILSSTYSKLYNDNFKNIYIYINYEINSHLFDKTYRKSYIFDIKDKKRTRIEFQYNYNIFNILVGTIFNDLNNSKYQQFKDFETKYLKKNLSKETYQMNGLYNMIVKEIFKYKSYTKDKFSIIMPLYNAESVIEKTLDSVYKGNENKKVNYELIIVNDKSTDNSLDVISNYIKKNNIINIIIINNEINIGAYKSRNRGIFKSSGEYLLVFDSDDYLPNDRMIKDLNLLKKNPKQLVLNTKMMRYSLEKDSTNCDILIPIEQYKDYENGIYKEISVTYKREFFVKNGFFQDNNFGSDSVLYYVYVLGRLGEYEFNKVEYVMFNDRMGYVSLNHKKNKVHLRDKYDSHIRRKYKNYTLFSALHKVPHMHSIIN